MQQKLTFRFPKWAFIVILVLPLFLPIVLIFLQWQKEFPRLASPCLLSAPNIVLLPLFVDAQEPKIVNRKNDIENQLTRLLQKDLGYNLRDRQKYEPLSQRNYQGDSTAKEQLLLLAKQDKIDLLIQGQLQRQDEKLGVSVEVFFCKTSQLKRLEMTFQDGADNPEWRKDPGQSHHGIMLQKLSNPAKNPGVASEKQVAILDGGTYYTNSDNKSLINICRGIVGGASLPRLFPLNAQNAENEIALCVSDRNATFLFRNGITWTMVKQQQISTRML